MDQDQDDTMRLNDFETFKKQFTKRHLTKPDKKTPANPPFRDSTASSVDVVQLKKKSSFEEAQDAFEQRRQELIVKVDSPLSPPPQEPLPTVPRHVIGARRRAHKKSPFDISFDMGLSNFLSSRFWAVTVAFYVVPCSLYSVRI